MSNTPLTEQELSRYRSHIGVRNEEIDTVAPEAVHRIAAALGRPWAGIDSPLPAMWHYGLFLPTTSTPALGIDGHPPRGGFFPDIRLPRRMFAGADIRFHAPLKAMQTAIKTSEISSVDYRRGKNGDLVFVRVASRIAQQDVLCVEEEQTVVYRGYGPQQPTVVPLPDRKITSDEDWVPTTVELFRFSAVTFNSHRIHYDHPYTTETEGYPALVVQGPLIAMRLCALAEKTAGPLNTFKFRAEAPLFVNQPVRLTASISDQECRVTAQRCDGVTAMNATATF